MKKAMNFNLKRLSFRFRILVLIGVSIFTSIVIPHWLHISAKILLVWDAGIIVFLLMTLFTMLNVSPDQMYRCVDSIDEKRIVIWVLLIAAACASFLAIFYMIRSGQNAPFSIIALHVILSAVSILSSWLLVHTIFTVHYAHEYYQKNQSTGQIVKGVAFPHDNEPDYLDFLYFSFVIGMTSQVSDVSVTSRPLRRLSLIHGILSFFFNTIILAMSINLIAGLL